MNILVTGGAGFIGSHLVDRLLEAGHQVCIIDDLSTGKKEYLNPQAKFYELDVRDQSIKKIFTDGNFDYVFHLAAQMQVIKSVEDPEFDKDVNVNGSHNVFLNSAATGVKKVIFFSTGGAIYGNVNSPADENFPANPDSPYAAHKYEAEQDLQKISKEHNLDYAILRPANVYGPRQYKGGEGAVIAVFTYNALEEKECTVYGDGNQTRDFVYVADVVDACLEVIKKEVNGIYNIGSGKETSVLDLIRTLTVSTGQELKYKHAPARSGEIQRSVLDAKKALNSFGWQAAVSLEEGLKKTLAWVKSL